jgi:hypothetical protein
MASISKHDGIVLLGLLAKFEFDLVKTIFDSAQVSLVSSHNSLDTVQTRGQFASGFDDFLDDLFPDRLGIVSAHFQFLPAGIHITNLQIQRMKASEHLLLESLLATQVLCVLVTHDHN